MYGDLARDKPDDTRPWEVVKLSPARTCATSNQRIRDLNFITAKALAKAKEKTNPNPETNPATEKTRRSETNPATDVETIAIEELTRARETRARVKQGRDKQRGKIQKPG
jgi:hypothetical protein